MTLVDHNATQIRAYLTILSPLIDKGAPVMDQNFDANGKGPRGAISDRLHDVIDDNRLDLEQLRRLENELRATNLENGGHQFSDLLLELDSHPGCTREWDSKKIQAFRQMSYVMSYALRVRDREHKLNLLISRRDRQMSREDKAQAAREDAGQTKRKNTQYSLLVLGRELLEIRRERGGTLEDAIEAYRKLRKSQKREDKSVRRLIDAWNLVKHEWEDGAA